MAEGKDADDTIRRQIPSVQSDNGEHKKRKHEELCNTLEDEQITPDKKKKDEAIHLDQDQLPQPSQRLVTGLYVRGGKVNQNHQNSVFNFFGQQQSDLSLQWKKLAATLTTQPMSFEGSSTPSTSSENTESAILGDHESIRSPCAEGSLHQFVTARKKKIQSLEGELATCYEDDGVEKLDRILEELRKLRETDCFDRALKIAEYDLTYKENINDSVFENLQSFLAVSGIDGVVLVAKKAAALIDQGHYLKVMILMKLVLNMSKMTCDLLLDKQLDLMEALVCTTSQIEEMSSIGDRSRNVALRLRTKFMKEILGRVRAIKGKAADKHVSLEMACINIITISLNDAHEYTESIRYGEEEANKLRLKLGENVFQQRYYGTLIHTVGKAHFAQKEFSKAKEYFVNARGIFEKILEYENEGERAEDITLAEADIELTRKFSEYFATDKQA